MSWDITLFDKDTDEEVLWKNYTHNTTPMILQACELEGIELSKPWWAALVFADYPKGLKYIEDVLNALRKHPELEVHNPANGWGSYEGLVYTLQELYDYARLLPLKYPNHTFGWDGSG